MSKTSRRTLGVGRDKVRSSGGKLLVLSCVIHTYVMISAKQLLHVSGSHRERWTEKALELSKNV